ncbi:MAG: SUMF1/EgtB/PvdO family nonheme iron enzyme, partial [Kiloniellales bacterium]|nr:SUMF1/EgtB/PvdO family nonheme iron enzyme [Kiloniellales bacterium]
MSRKLAASLALSLLLLGRGPVPALAEEEPWEEKYWNPAPMGDDFVLPLPCGGRLAFRRIDTPSEANWLSDERVLPGIADETFGYSEYTRFSHIAGSLSEGGDPGKRYYYLGKYEVTRGQFDAVMGGDCQKPSTRQKLPAVEISWFEAVDFTRRLTEWLYGNRADSLPREGGSLSYLRLPTETEWEYAARGGAAVSVAERRATLFPMEGDLSSYAWYAGPGSCDNDIRLIGRLKPNPLGLHDMLGNVEEMVLEPFGMNRVGQSHGQVGAFFAKGGSCLTSREQMRSSLRVEHSYFDERKKSAARLPMTGFRPVISAPATTDHGRVGDLKEDWNDLRQLRTAPEREDPVTALEKLAEDAETPLRQQELRDIAAAFNAEVTRRNEIEARSARTAITTGALLIRTYRDNANLVIRQERFLKARTLQGDPEEELDKFRAALERANLKMEVTEQVYLGLLTQSSDDFTQEQLESQLQTALPEIERLGGSKLAK